MGKVIGASTLVKFSCDLLLSSGKGQSGGQKPGGLAVLLVLQVLLGTVVRHRGPSALIYCMGGEAINY